MKSYDGSTISFNELPYIRSEIMTKKDRHKEVSFSEALEQITAQTIGTYYENIKKLIRCIQLNYFVFFVMIYMFVIFILIRMLTLTQTLTPTLTLTHVGHRTVVIEGGFGAQSFVVPNEFLPILACLPMHEVQSPFLHVEKYSLLLLCCMTGCLVDQVIFFLQFV